MPSFLNLISDFLNKNLHYLNKEDLNLQLLSHEDYPSFRSVSDTFDYFGIENLAATVPIEALDQLPDFFLTLAKIDGKDLLVSVYKTKKGIICKSTETKTLQYTFADFKKIWSGTIIVVEKNENPEPSTNKQTIWVAGLALLLVLAVLIYPFAFHTAILGTISVLGVLLSWLIIKEELGIQDTITSKICSSINEKGSCSKIINSKEKFLGFLSFSNASGVFFTAQLFTLLFIGFDKGFFTAVLALSVPVLLFSIYSQAVVLKEWCALCLGTALLLILEMAVVFMTPLPLEINMVYILKTLLITAFTYLGISFLKGLMEKSIELKKTKVDFYKFKRNHDLFTSLLYKKQLPHPIEVAKNFEIGFGSNNPALTINAVTNPLCGYCTDAFKAYFSLLEKYGDDIRINFIFNIHFEKTDNIATKIVLSVLDVYASDPKKALHLLKEWFDHKDISHWENKTVASDSEKLDILKAHRSWCETNGILYTPATFINTFYYPNEYKIQEFSLFADEIIRQHKEQNIMMYQN